MGVDMLRVPQLTSLLALALPLLPSCTGTPQPIPPPARIFDTREMHLVQVEDGSVQIRGNAGSVLAQAGELSIVNYSFNASGAPSVQRVPVGADGAFEANFADSLAEDTYRLLAFSDTGTPIGEPVEITQPGTSIESPPVLECARLVGMEVVELGEVPLGETREHTVRLENRCDAALDVGALLLFGSDDWGLSPDQPEEVPVGGAIDLALSWTPTVATEEEQLVLLKIDGENYVVGVSFLGSAF